MAPRPELTHLIETLDADGIEGARDDVRPGDVPELAEWYWTRSDWDQRLALVDLLQDQYHPSMDRMLVHVLQAPGDGDDWVDIPKMVAVAMLSEEHDNFTTYLGDRGLLAVAVREVLAMHGVMHEPAAPTIGPSRPAFADEPPLLSAVMGHRVNEALELIAGGADPNSKRTTGDQSVLWWAAGSGLESVVDALLAAGARADDADHHSSTPLVQAATSGHASVVATLLAAGANPCSTISDGRSVLGMSVRGGKVAILEALLEAGADLQSPQPTFTPLAAACFEGTTAMVQMLVERGADVNRAITYMNYHDTTPLMFAAQAGKTKMVRALLDGGADANATDGNGKTAAGYARGKRADEIRAMLDS